MYLEIHTVWYDAAMSFASSQADRKDPISTFYHPGPERVIRLETIRMLTKEPASDGSIVVGRLKVSDDHLEDILVPEEEADRIKKKLLSGSSASLSAEVQALTAAVRDLWQLLRARMH